ncbi:MAG: TdeIII family type II restriction endonuclease, partial [Spirochaetales bacterium]|nr:TdeIII family type II restriction endonuclease [Spirochaetales bacterium]
MKILHRRKIMLDQITAEIIIKETVKKSIISYTKKQKNKKRKFQVLDLIIPKEREIRSIVGGLETSLGKTLWEPLAKSLASKNGFEVIESDLKCPNNMPSRLNNTLQNIIEDRISDNPTYDATQSHDELKKVCQYFINNPIDSFTKAPRGFGVDICLKKDSVNYFFDTKTVQPNIGRLTTCMKQILNWYSYFYSKEPEGTAYARIVFPYNPYQSANFWDKVIG